MIWIWKKIRFVKAREKTNTNRTDLRRKQPKAVSSTNDNFSSSRVVWQKSNTFTTLAVYLKNDFKWSEKNTRHLFHLQYRQKTWCCPASLEVVFAMGKHWICCCEYDMNLTWGCQQAHRKSGADYSAQYPVLFSCSIVIAKSLL